MTASQNYFLVDADNVLVGIDNQQLIHILMR
jgi:hypothetical protein